MAIQMQKKLVTLESVMAMYLGMTRANPHATILDLLQTLNPEISDPRELLTWISDNLDNEDLDADKVPIEMSINAMFSLNLGDISGKVSHNENTAENYKDKIFTLLGNGKDWSREDLEKSVIPNYVKDSNPQNEADLDRAFTLLNTTANVVRISAKGTVSTRGRWTTIRRTDIAGSTPVVSGDK
jgi:hypothetical protein